MFMVVEEPEPSRSAQSDRPRRVADLVTTDAAVRGDTPIKTVVDRFEHNPEVDAMAVLSADGRIGFLSRARFFLQLGTKFGFAVFENRPISLLAEEGSIVDADADPVEVVHIALQRESARIYDDFIVVDRGRFVGLVSMRSLMAHHKELLAGSLAEVSSLDARNRQLEEVHRIQSEFVANMTHELRSPLNVMLGVARLMTADPAASAPQQHSLGVLLGRGQHLLGIVNNLLDLSKLQAGAMNPLYEPVDIVRYLDEIVEGTEALFVGRSVRLQVRFRSLPEVFVTDPIFIRRILDNLLSNAAKFTDAGTVTLAAHALPGELVVSVIDTGIGIRSEDMGRLFTRFGQLENTHSRRPGTGLGLAIVKGLVDALGGRIAVESAPGSGSTFTVVIPDARAHVADGPKPRREH
jgi:signal transduction histidine kinase